MSEAAINVALTLLGEPESTGPNDSSSWVTRCRNALPRVVRSALEDYPWNFCEEVAELSPTADAALDWEYRFPLPANCRRLNGVSDRIDRSMQGCPDRQNQVPFRLRKNHILCNSETVFVWFNDGSAENLSGSWSQKFTDLIGAGIAEKVCPVTDQSAIQRIDYALKAARRDAKAHDAVQNSPQKWVRRGGTMHSRLAGRYSRGN